MTGLDARMSVSFTGAVEYQGCSFSTCVLHEPARDQASPRAHRQDKISDGAKKPQRGIPDRVCDGQSEDDRRPRFERSDLDREYDTAS
jgi:hypothetical protein